LVGLILPPLHEIVEVGYVYLCICTLQVITFLYAVMRCTQLGFRTALIVTPVNVLHNWREEFTKWHPVELKPLRVYMMEDVTRYVFFWVMLSYVSLLHVVNFIYPV
jgi:hypothetical protein